jgi:hypothetical protein
VEVGGEVGEVDETDEEERKEKEKRKEATKTEEKQKQNQSIVSEKRVGAIDERPESRPWETARRIGGGRQRLSRCAGEGRGPKH